ncbi:hypothetical protein [Nostoc sp.]|uniref:hypothetical protein n=1 Tax=Nostoc sp. TaxID=1180 RepID=UPI002FF84A8A
MVLRKQAALLRNFFKEKQAIIDVIPVTENFPKATQSRFDTDVAFTPIAIVLKVAPKFTRKLRC